MGGAQIQPELSVVVLSHSNEDTICSAIDSLLSQEEPLEIVVSHSGDGDNTPELLAERYPEIKVVSSPETRLPGAARNAGIGATRAPYVAFLAGDCIALPGWAAARLAHHRAGVPTVGSAIVPTDESPSEIAAYLARDSWRMPHLHRPRAPLSSLGRNGWFPAYGLSYDRGLLTQLGPFPETYLVGEDVAVNDRLRDAGIDPVWAPEVLTGHTFPHKAVPMLRDQYRRGRIRGSVEGSLLWRLPYALRRLADLPLAVGRALRPGSPTKPLPLIAALPLTLAAVLVGAVGSLRAGYEVSPHLRRQRAAQRQAMIARIRGLTKGNGGPTKLELLRELTAADVRLRFGAGPWRLLKWIAEPVAAVAVYLGLVTFVLDRAGTAPGLTIACAVVPFHFLSAAVANALSAVPRQRRLISTVAFDRQLLPIASALSQCVPFLASVLLLALPLALYGIAPTWAAALLPLAAAITVALGLALAYPATLFGLWFPELRSFVSLALRALFFLGAGLVSLEQVPDSFSTAISLNPLTGLFEAYRSILVRGDTPAAWELLYPLVFAAALLALFIPVYSREQRHFAKLLG